MSDQRRPPSALWLFDKPVGETSFEVVQRFKAEHAGPWPLKASHGGVLDPFAHGLLIILSGAATRLFERLHEVPKRYRAEVQWGTETDTGDAGGAVVASASLVPSAAALEAALAPFRGWTEQVPPATSNKRVDGERAYEKAHRGEVVTLPASRVFLQDARWLPHEQPGRSWLEVSVRGGFYLRSLVRDLGRALGSAAHLVGLERTQIGPWSTPRAAPERITGRQVLPWLEARELTDAEWGLLRRGEPLPGAPTEPPAWPLPEGFPAPEWQRFFHLGRLVAVHSTASTILLPGGI